MGVLAHQPRMMIKVIPCDNQKTINEKNEIKKTASVYYTETASF